MKRTRMLSILLAVLLVFSCSAAVLAAEPMTVTVETKADAVSVGEEVSLTVSIAGNPGFTNYEWAVEYDTASLELKKVENKLSAYLATREEEGRVNLALMSAEPISENGTAFVVTFLVKEKAAAGLSEVKLSSKKLANLSQTLQAQYIAGGVTIASATGGSTTGGSTTGGSTTGAVKVTDIAVGVEKYTVIGQTVTVTSQNACKLGYLEGGKYVAITPTDNGDGSYSFEVPEGITDVVLVIKGDINGDGEIKGSDITQLKAGCLGKLKTPLTELQIFAGDIVSDGEIKGSDITQLKAAFLGKIELSW